MLESQLLFNLKYKAVFCLAAETWMIAFLCPRMTGRIKFDLCAAVEGRAFLAVYAEIVAQPTGIKEFRLEI